ncbi:MAG: hypothetical protein CVU61_02220 [Deltaproteobacteria bacterium HGW-Deltaproteobacteria-19]|jgi:hypothetical protein|nr:MAG: hypothetical protein CVU61_02220 [Deltaproteobacteria bacterium HGW-Deltaproteobacteria-19]
MKIYHYHSETGEFLRESEARLDPLETKRRGEPVCLIPAHATTEAPPAGSKGYTAVFGEKGWSFVEDHRGGTIYRTSDGTPTIVEALGPIPEGYTDLPPCRFPVWTGDKWIEDAVQVKAAEEAEAKAEAKARLHEIDLKSIRYLREWVAKQPGAPEFIKTYEADAIAERNKLSK